MLKARIIIVEYNSQSYLEQCIAALATQTDQRFEVVVVNNGPEPIKSPAEWSDYDWLTILETRVNTGFAGGSNIGAKGAQTEWIITLNPDAWPEPNWFETLMGAADSQPNYAMLSSTLLQQSHSERLDGAGEVYSIFGLSWRGGQGQSLSALTEDNREVFGPCGAAAAYRREVFERLNGFDEDYFCFLEDVDLALRCQSIEQNCLHVRHAYVHHVGGGSSDGDGSAFQNYHSYKNQIRVIVKNTPILLLWPHMFIYYLSQIWFTFRSIRQPYWKARVKGLWQGLKSIPKTLMRDRSVVQNNRVISNGAYWRLLNKSPFALRRKDIVPK